MTEIVDLMKNRKKKILWCHDISLLNFLFLLRDYVDSGSVYVTPDSGGECGVPYETYFPMPTSAKDKPWYSIEQGSVHFTVISTEHDWTENSEQVIK